VTKQFAAATLFTCVGMALQFLFWPFIEPRYWTVPSAALFLSALVAGVRGGALSMILSIAFVWYVLMPPRWTFWKYDASLGVWVLVFVFFGVLVSVLVERLLHERRKALNRFEATFEEAAIGIALLGLDGRFFATNQRNEKLLGYDKDELCGMHCEDITHPDDRELTREWVQRVALGETKTVTGDKRVIRKDGTTVWVSLTLALKRVSRDDDAFIIASAEDITERKAAEAALAERTATSEARAERLGAERLTALGGIAVALSHEINQPFLAATAHLESARSLAESGTDGRSKSIREALGFASAQIMRAGEIIRHLREFAKSGEPDKTFQSLHQLIRYSLDFKARSLRAANITIALRLNADRDRVLVDRVQIAQVLTNLIRNAREAMSGCEERELCIETSLKDDENIRVDVTDTGVGIPDEVKSTVFEPFATTKNSGIGVGLAITASIVAAHHGEIWVDSSSERGTKLSLILPLESGGPTGN
jgi:PAS domain S-box-containing protein